MVSVSKDLDTDTKHPFRELSRALAFDENILANVREPLLILDVDFKVKWANNSFFDFFALKPQDTLGTLVSAVGDKQFNIPKLLELLQKLVINNTNFDNFEIQCVWQA